MERTRRGHATMSQPEEAHFSTAVAGLPEVTLTERVDLRDGDVVALRPALRLIVSGCGHRSSCVSVADGPYARAVGDSRQTPS